MALIDRPIFLVGSERSGTTLLRLMLDHHPRIALKFESDYLATEISESGAFPEAGRYRDWLSDNRAFQASGFSVDARLDFVGLVNDFLQQKRTQDRKELVGATVHHQFRKLFRVWPNAKYLYLYRDGRDVAISVMRMGWAGNVYVAADRWLEAEREWEETRARLRADQWLEVRYEDLIEGARPQLERICAFLGVEYSERMFDYVKTSTYRAPDPALRYQWKTSLSRTDLERLERKLGDRLSRRGYEVSGHRRGALPWPLEKYLYLESRVRAYGFRLRRYGAALTLQESLLRRFGLQRLHRKVTNRINRITDAHMK